MISFQGSVIKEIYRSKKDDDYCILEIGDSKKVKGYLPGVHKGFHLSGTGVVPENGEHQDTVIIKKVDIGLPYEIDQISQYCVNLLGFKEKNPYEEIDGEYESSDDDIAEYAIACDQMGKLCDWLGFSVLDQIKDNIDYVEKAATNQGWFDGNLFTLKQLRYNLLMEDELRSIAAELRSVDPEYAKYTRALHAVFVYTPEIADHYDNTLECLSKNPYVFCFRDVLAGYSFEVADAIAAKYQLPKDSYDRCCAGIKHAFYSKIASEGHVFASEETLIQKSMEVLMVAEDVLRSHLDSMYRNRILVKESDERVYTAEYYNMEMHIAEKLSIISRQECERNLIYPDYEKIEAELGITFSEKQKEAIRTAVNSNITLVTGGPGTGKTTIVRGIIEAFRNAGECSIELAAPTGKAAVRLKDLTGYDAKTIHLLLGLKPNSSRRAVSRITDSVIIIDEASMVDIDIMDKLMFAIDLPVHLILVGDADQLPSVGPGYIFHDMIESGCFNVCRLTEVFRQGKHSSIKLLAESIIKGEMIQAPVGESDYHFIPAENDEDIKKKIIETIERYLHEGRKKTEIQVLTPRIKNSCGVKELNDILQKLFNPNTEKQPAYKSNNELIYSGDRVMHTQNDYHNHVFNGEMTDETTVDFIPFEPDIYLSAKYPPNGNEVNYIPGKYNADWVTRAYAITVHKSQGSEYPVIIMPIFANRNLYRNLIYTAATRAKEQLIFIGYEKDLKEGILKTKPRERNTYLTKRIQNEYYTNLEKP